MNLSAHKVLLALVLFLLSARISAQEFPEYQSVYLNDFADIIDAETEARIVAALQQAKEERDQEITVLAINSRTEYGDHRSIESFATSLFNQWGIGNPQRNDGVLVLVAVIDREMRIELGSGFPPAADRIAKSIIDDTMIPQFRNNNYAHGIELGVNRVIDRLDFRTIHESTASDTSESSSKSNHPLWILLAGLGALLASGFGVRQYLNRRPRTCPACNQKMRRLSETTDDVYLSAGQVKEEQLDSKNYDVWYCDFDKNTIIVGRRKWFSSYSACNKCGFRTLRSKQTTLRAATTYSAGEARKDFTCQACHSHWSTIITLPIISESNSSSSSFGGGSSSGGGASGSW